MNAVTKIFTKFSLFHQGSFLRDTIVAYHQFGGLSYMVFALDHVVMMWWLVPLIPCDD